MLTGDIIPGSGTATLNGLDILKQQNDVRRLLGYCPQFDALIDTLTAREHLVLFARIKGVPEDIMDEYVEHLILRLGLQEGIADKPTKGYSGGNKRKLCVGIALIGNPPIVFLSVLTHFIHSQQQQQHSPRAQRSRGNCLIFTFRSVCSFVLLQ